MFSINSRLVVLFIAVLTFVITVTETVNATRDSKPARNETPIDLAYGPLSPSANLVVNGDFETGTISPFSTAISSGSATINNDVSFVHGGTFSAKVTTSATAGASTGIGGGGGCSGGVRIPVNSSKQYRWTGWIFVPAGTTISSARVRIAWYSVCSGGGQLSTVDSNAVTTAAGTWTQVTGTATSPSNATFAEVRLLAAPSTAAPIDAYFDDVAFDLAVPIVTSVSPTSGPTAGGTSVTITGASLSGTTGVSFGANPATSFTLNSATSITATAPPGSAGAVDVTVTTALGTSATSAADQFTYLPPLSGTYTVGAGGNYATLTAAANAYTTLGLSAPVTFLLTDATYSANETFPITFGRANGSATNTLTIKPNTGAAPTISSQTSSTALPLIYINGGQLITIDGSNNGANTQNLTVSNFNPAAASGSAIAFFGTTVHNTIKNVIAKSRAGDGTIVLGNSSDTIVQNCLVTSVDPTRPAEVGISMSGNFATPSTGNVISGNIVSEFEVDGIEIASTYTGTMVTGNTIIHSATTSGAGTGINFFAPTDATATINGNTILMANSSPTIGAVGFFFGTGTAGTSLTFSNNSIVMQGGNIDTVGIWMRAAFSTANFFYNSVYIDNTGPGRSTCLWIEDQNIDNVFNNILFNTRLSGDNYAIKTTVNATVNSNYNDLFATGINDFVVLSDGTPLKTLADWQAFSAKDGNSVSGDPHFTSAVDLHILPSSGMTSVARNAGTPVGGITKDIDGDTRSTSTPDMGADEFEDTAAQIQFSASNYSMGEGGGHIDVTVTRTGDTSGTSTVNYTTSDEAPGAGHASQASDYEISVGTLTFNPGETSKTFTVLIVDDMLVESDETIGLGLSGPTGTGVGLGRPNTAELTIIDNDNVATSVNPYDDPRFFVRQQYLDFLNREPDQSGWDFWTNTVTECGADAACTEVHRINVSAAFFLSKEFQNTGYLAYVTHRSAFGSNAGSSPAPVLYTTFMHDVQELGKGYVDLQPNADQVLENNKVAYFNEFVARPEFLAKYPASLNNQQFVDNLLTTANLPTTDTFRDSLLTGLNGGTKTRAMVLRSVAESSTIQTRELNAGFVTMEYFGYLRRDPDTGGFNFWFAKLNSFNGNFIQAEMVKAFIESTEDRQRFGTP